MKLTSVDSHSLIAFRGQSDHNNHPTLSRVAQEAGSQVPVTSPVSHSPLSAVQLALSNQKQAEQTKLEQARQEFLNNPMAEVNGQPFTGLDLLKLIDEATEKRWVKRDWGLFAVTSFFSIATVGILPLVEEDSRGILRNGLKKGFPPSQFDYLLGGLKCKDGQSLDGDATRVKLANLGLIIAHYAPFRMILTPIARKILAEQKA